MNIIAFVGAGIIGTVLSVVLKQYKPEFSMYITLITGMLMLGAAVSAVKPALDMISSYRRSQYVILLRWQEKAAVTQEKLQLPQR